MLINFLELENFRNYERLKLEFNPETNIIYGENGQGKTNILESIYLCSCARSHKGSKDAEMIKLGMNEAHIKGEFQGEYSNRRVDIHLRKSKGKGLAIDKLPIKKLSELYGNIFVVIFSTEDLDIIKRGPSERRKFMDSELCQIDRVYVDDLINYNRILVQRRELFKKIDEDGGKLSDLTETLDVWDLQLVKFGSKIIERRKRFLDEINEIIYDIHYSITSGREKLSLKYEPNVDKDDFYEILLKNREKDSFYKHTSCGPHRDDFTFFDGKTDLKIYGSNGQQRTAALSLKLSEIKIIENVKREKPVLLLDDVLSELDRNRQEQLLKSLNGTQTIITCTGVDEFVESRVSKAKRFHIKNAKII